MMLPDDDALVCVCIPFFLSSLVIVLQGYTFRTYLPRPEIFSPNVFLCGSGFRVLGVKFRSSSTIVFQCSSERSRRARAGANDIYIYIYIYIYIHTYIHTYAYIHTHTRDGDVSVPVRRI